MSINIEVESGKSVKLLTAGKYCDRDILVTGTGGVSGGSSEDVRYVTFMSHDGTVELGKKAVAVGDDCADPIDRGIFSTPTKESTAQYNYTHVGWATTPNGALDSDALKAVTEDRTVYANFAAVVRYYTISYYDGDTLLKTESLAYGAMPSYKPTKDGYDFVAWEPAVSSVVGEASYIATWKVKASFETSTWTEIAEICDSGNAATAFKVGDRKPVTITYSDGTNETIYFRIVGMGVDQKTDGTYAPLTLMADSLLKDALKPASAYNKGNDEFYAMDNVQATMESIYAALPDDLRSIIKSVLKFDNSFRRYEQYVFIPSRKNLTGSEGTSSEYNASTVNLSLLPQTQYEYFSKGGSVVRSKVSDASADDYWTSSCKKYSTASYTTAYFDVMDDAAILGSNHNAASATHGICPCFCI